MKIFLTLFDFLISLVVGFYINLNITSEIIVYFFSGNYKVYIVIFALALLIQIFFVFSIIRLFRNKSIDTFTFKAILVLYSSVMLVLLFGRQVMETSINLNLLYLFDFNKDNISQNILNIIFFIPIGYLLKNLPINKSINYTLIGLIVIELLQLITRRGIFDINDIILNSIGIFIGYYFSNKYKINLLSK